MKQQTKPGSQLYFSGQKYWVVYVDHGRHIYRILYLDTEEAKAVMGSFEFLE